MSDELAEEYDRLIRPELYSKADRWWKETVSKLDLPDADEAEQAWRMRVKAHLATYEQEILNAAGLSLDDLVSARFAKKRRRLSGEKLPQTREKITLRRTALEAIREADLNGLDWGETIKKVQGCCQEAHRDAEPDRKTVDAWLRVLHKWELVAIDPPAPKGRGRPRKKE